MFQLRFAAATSRREFDNPSHKASLVGITVSESKESPTFPVKSASGNSPFIRVSYKACSLESMLRVFFLTMSQISGLTRVCVSNLLFEGL